ncbi:MAG: hypothetical protein AB1645_09725 [Bacillota bacterium]
MYCPESGGEVAALDVFCPRCGRRVKGHRKPVGWLIAGLVVLLVAGAAGPSPAVRAANDTGMEDVTLSRVLNYRECDCGTAVALASNGELVIGEHRGGIQCLARQG